LKTRFKFPFVSKQAIFEETQEFKGNALGTLTPRKNSPGLSAKTIDSYFHIEIEPFVGDETKRFPDGYIYVTLPGSPEESHFLAKEIVYGLKEHIEFFYKDFEISGGMVTAERIPENEEEAMLIGEEKYWAQITVQEVLPGEKFDRRILSLFPSSRKLLRLIRQYNIARKSRTQIDYFLGMFKILESQFHIGNRRAREALLRSDVFCRLVLQNIKVRREPGEFVPIRDDELPNLVNTLVNIRDKCAHLKEQNKFGYAPYDPEVFEEVDPFTGIVEKIARESIMEKYRTSNEGLFNSVFSEHSASEKE
jgi:hypothetical protein